MATIVGTAGNDTLAGTSGNDTISGLGGNDVLLGSAGNDSLRGNDGTDWLEGGAGSDNLGGGSGQDSFVFREAGSANADVLSDYSSNWDNIQLDAAFFSSLGASGRFASGDARFVANSTGTAQDAGDRIVLNTSTGQLFYDADGSGSGAAQHFATLPSGRTVIASDFWVFGTAPSSGQTINGTSGNDSLVGGPGNDTINGLGGNDTLDGMSGSDRLNGGDGDDTLRDYHNFDEGVDDTLDGGLGNDTYDLRSNPFQDHNPVLADAGGIDTVFSNHDFVLPGGIENLLLFEGVVGTGNALDNVITTHSNEPHQYFIDGADGNDTLVGGEDIDQMQGGRGDDRFVVQSGSATFSSDAYDGGEGFDFVDLGGAPASNGWSVDLSEGTLDTGDDPFFIYATLANIEGVSASPSDDRIFGSSVANALQGAGGNDTLDGRSGNDTLSGGAGADELFFTVSPGAANADVITDFVSGSDQIHLDNVSHANLGAPGNFSSGDARFFAGAGATSGQDASDRVIYNTTNGDLFYDADGSGAAAAQRIATLQGAPALSASDIAVIGGATPMVGTEGDDTLTGTEGNDTMEGRGGNDLLSALGGRDLLDGGAGNDTLDGGTGTDTMDGGLGNDTYHVEPGDVLSDPGGVDLVITFESWALGAGFENVTLRGGAGVAGNELANVMRIDGSFTGAGLSGMGGNDTIFGGGVGNGGGFGEGNDNLSGGDGGDEIHGAGGLDNIWGEAGNDLLFGDDGNDFIQGQEGNDTMRGGAGNDTFKMYGTGVAGMNEGQDSIDGGVGVDWVQFDGPLSSSGVVINLANGTATGGGPGGAGSASLAGIENAFGTKFGDRIAGDGGANALAGMEGSDTLDGAAGIDTLTGGADADAFIFAAAPGSANADLISDFTSGADKLRLDGSVMTNLGASGDFGPGDARFYAAAGATGGNDADDRVVYNTTTRQVFYDADGNESGGAALIATLQPGATLAATDIAVDNGSAPPGGQVITGTSGNDTLSGGPGNDTLNGLGGNDLFLAGGSGGADVIDGGAGFDSIEFKERATSGVVVDYSAGTITGGGPGTISFTGIERVVAGNFNDSMTGSAAGQTLTGQGGADTLWGAGGIDTLWGGAGADTFIFRETGSANADSVRDWASGSDKVALDDAAMSALGGTGNFAAGDARFAAGAGFTSGRDASDRVVYNTSTGSLYYDADGSGAGAAQLIATLAGNPAVAAADIVVI